MDGHTVDLPAWEEIDGALEREYRCKDFAAAMDFVIRIAEAAERANHHPDIDIRWNRVRLRWRTHSQDAITQRDVEMARRSDELAP
jgi:4a-hydroxytetrahydrobiopterin dehydratase